MEVYTQMKHVRIAAMVLAVCLLVVCRSAALAQKPWRRAANKRRGPGQTGEQPEYASTS